MTMRTNRRDFTRTESRRGGITLIEVLVVVAIIVVLASVSSIYVFKFFDDSKKDKALMDMQALNTAYQSYKLKTDEELTDITQLAPYMTQGSSALTDPYGSQYQIRAMSNAEQQDRVQFFTVIKGEEIFWPRK